jgi:hypothetical protein
LTTTTASETEEQRGALSLRSFGGHGAVRLLRYDEDAQVMEYAAGAELITLAERGEDERARRMIAQVIAQLHSVPQDAPYDGLVPLDRWFGALFAKAGADKPAGIDSIYVRSAIPTSYKSSGVRPVCFARRASMRGPSSSVSWNANTTSGHLERSKVLCDPEIRLTRHPIRMSGAKTRRAFVAGH